MIMMRIIITVTIRITIIITTTMMMNDDDNGGYIEPLS